jgi:CheY-like chemotaxis protein
MAVGNQVVLAVDDTPSNLDIILETLEDRYEVSVATSGAEALELLEDLVPDLILLDIMMPGMNGYEVCERIKQEEHLKDIPVIFCTALDSTNDIVQGFEKGAVDYVVKPFNPAELSSRVKTHIDLKISKETISVQAAEQKELLHILCHDLANPFTSILGVLNILDDLPDEFAEYFDLLRKAALNGVEVIDLVRQIRKAEEKSIELTGIDLDDALVESINMLKDKIEAKNLTIQKDCTAIPKIAAEKTSLVNSVLNNVMTNAIKFSFEKDAILIDADVTNSAVVLTIRDSGIGMPQSLVDDLFDITKMTSRPGTSGEKGTGFGMPLIQKFMHLYGGEITVSSWDETTYPDKHGTAVELTFLKSAGEEKQSG